MDIIFLFRAGDMSLLRANVLVMLMVFIAGCNTRTVSPPSQSSKEAGEASSDDVLTSALYQLGPENFGLSSSTEKPVSLLNSWKIKQKRRSKRGR